MEFNFMPHIFLLDVVILTGIFYVFCCAMFGHIANWTPVGRTLFLTIGIAGSLFALLYFRLDLAGGILAREVNCDLAGRKLLFLPAGFS
jgi:hypothetical protein